MAEIVDFLTQAKTRIYKRFPPLGLDEIPNIYAIHPIEYKERLDEFDIIFWHRLLKEIYQHPTEIECELVMREQDSKTPEIAILRRQEENSKWDILGTTEANALRIQSGEMKPWPSNWRYFFRLPSQGIVLIGTKDKHTKIYIELVSEEGRFTSKDEEEAKQFISLLFDEANKARKNQLFAPRKQFQEAEGLKSYLLFNVYLQNYLSARIVLGTAISSENNLHDEFRNLHKRSDVLNIDEQERRDQCMLAQGMYFSSAISHLYIALEGFINILFHSFLRKSIRNGDFNIEKRFDIEQKLKLLPFLCDGFRQEEYNVTSDLLSKFRKLTVSRNSIFHAKVDDSLKSLVFVEDGFLYHCILDKESNQLFPSLKGMLSKNDVIAVKDIVDEIIKMIVNSMTDETKALTEKYILNSAIIPFFVRNDGSLLLGQSSIGKEGQA